MKHAGDAFVIWLDPPAARPGADAPLHGLVEHVPTTTRRRFAGAEELLAFVRASRRPRERTSIRHPSKSHRT